MTNSIKETWMLRPRHGTASTSQASTKSTTIPSAPVDLSRNRELAMRARLSVTDGLAQTMMTNWLLHPGRDQAAADRAVRIVETCAAISGTNLGQVGDWDALALSLLQECQMWMFLHSGLFRSGGSASIEHVLRTMFGSRFVGNIYVERFDHLGDAMLVNTSLV